MMGRLNDDEGQLSNPFCLEEAVPDDHLVREIAAVLDLAWCMLNSDPLFQHWSALDRPGADDPDAHHRLRVAIRSGGRCAVMCK